jgi:hypothetical protein
VFEQHGVPSASIVTHVFRATGKAMARSWGVPDFRFLEMKHPIANLTDSELDERASQIVPEVVKLLLEGQSEAIGVGTM